MVKLPGEPRSDTMTGWEPEPAPEADDQPQLVSGPSIAQRPAPMPAPSPKDDLYGELQRLGGSPPNLMSGPEGEQSSPLYEAYKPALERMVKDVEADRRKSEVAARERSAQARLTARDEATRTLDKRLRTVRDMSDDEFVELMTRAREIDNKFARNSFMATANLLRRGGKTMDSPEAKSNYKRFREYLNPDQRERYEPHAGSIPRGVLSLRQGINVAAAELGLISPEEASANIAKHESTKEKYEPPAHIQEGLRAISEAPDALTAFKLVAKYPDSVLSMVGESLGQSLAPAVGGTIVGGLIGSLPGAMIGGGLGSASVEYTASILDTLKRNGIDTKDQAAVYRAFTDPDFVTAARDKYIEDWEDKNRPKNMEEARVYAGKRAAAIGLFDALTLGLSGKIASLAAQTSGRIKRAGLAAGALSTEAAGGASGEATAQMITEGKIKPGEVVMEGLGEIVPGAGQLVATTAMQQARQPETGETPTAEQAEPDLAPPEPPAPAAPARSSAEIGTSGRSVPTKPVRAGLNTEPEVVTPDGSISMPVQTVLVELEDLVHATGDLQPRDRSRKESDEGVRFRAANLDPLRLLPERVSDGGAPVITQDGTIVSGNGRVMSIREVYTSQNLSDRAQTYRSMLGGAAEGMKHPVLVRKIQGNPDAEELLQFADRSNRPAVAQMSATERASRDAKAAGAEVMQLYQGGSFDAPQNREFLRTFVQKAVTPAERGAMAKDGLLTKEGEDRLNAAVLASAYGDPEVLQRMLESRDDNIRNITGALRDVSGLMLELQQSIAAGQTDPAFDITPQISEAARRIADMRSNNISPADALAQQDAFTQMDPLVEAMIRGFYNENLTRPISRQKMTALLTLYANEAKKHSGQEGLIPDETTPQDVLDLSKRNVSEAGEVVTEVTESAAAVGDLFGDGASADGGTDAGTGGGQPGSAADRGGQPARSQDGTVNTDEIAAKVVPEQRAFFEETFGPQEDLGTEPTAEQRSAFAEVLAGTAPRRQWQELVGATPEQIEALEREAVNQGALRITKTGQLRRTGQAKPAATAPTVAIPADARLDNAIAAREAEGALITQPIAEYAWRVELVRGDVKKVQALIEEINNDKSFDKSDVLELAHLVGYAPKSRTTKAQALESIVARSKDLADTRDLGILPAIRAYHGSPHDFDKFRMSQIGTGEGAQAYGHGLYFAENPAVARDYQEAVSSRHMEDFATAQGRRLPDWVAQQVQSGGIEDAIKTFEGRIAHNKEQLSNDPAQPWVIEDQINNQTEILQALKAIKSGEDAVRGRGRLYEVNIKANKEDFLDWDKPLSEQGEAVRKMAASREHQSAIKALVEPEALEYDPNWMNLVYGGDIVRYLESKGPVRVFDEDAFGSTPAAHPVKASKSLAEAGIPGIRYLDQGSRGSGSGTYNYVVFDDSLIEITAKDGEPVSQEVKDQVTQQMSGEALFRLGGEAPVRPEFEAVSQQWMEDVAAYARQLVPSDVAVRIADGLGSGNLRFRGSFDPMARLLEISMEIGPQQAMEVARHEAVHVARVSGLWTKDEWKILTERAKKVGAEPTMIDRDGGVVSAMPRYEDFYTEQAAALFRGNKRRQQAWVREHLNQERVATLAESYASGKASYGTKINALLDRIGNLLQAMVNAARGLGFQTANDIFARLERGEIAARGETQVAEPVPESTRNDFMVGDVQGEITTREMSDGGRIRIYKTDDETYAGIRESQNGSWSVQMLNAPNPDTAEQLYQAVEDDIGQYLSPDGWLTPQAYEYWLATDPASVEGHQETGALFYGMYVPPGRVDVGVRALEQVATQSTGVQQRQARQKAQALRTIAAKTGASPVLPAMRGDIPQPVPLGQGTATEKPSKTLSDLVQLFNEQITDPQRTGRLDPGTKRRAANQGGRLVGQYNKNTGVTRLAIPLDFVTLTHEGGHALEHNRKTRDAVGELKLTHAEELITPPAPNVPAPQMPASGFAGIEIDADTQRRLVEFIEADASLKAMTQQVAQAKSQPRMFGRAGYNVRAYTQAQELAGKTRDKLVRRLGRSIADAVINDIQQQGIAADQVADYAARRFAQSGQPQPRQELQFTEDQLSEAWADWFQEYVTAPDSARRIAPDLYAEFEEALDGADPETLSVLEEIQDGYQELIQANPVAAVRSRIQSTIRPGLLQEFNERLRDRGVRRGLGEIITEWMYKTYTSYADNKHPMKVAVKVLLDLAEQNGRIKVGKNEKLLLKTVNDPYKRWRLAEHAKVHATQVLQSGVILSGQIDSAGPSFREALVEAFGGQTAGKWNEDVKEEFGAYLIARRVLAEFRRHDNGERDIQPDQLIDRQYWQQTKDELEQKYARFAKAADMMYEFNRNVLTWKFENGFLDEKLYQELMQREDYAPLNRVMDEKGGMASLTTARGRNKSGMIKRQLTSTRDFINPVEQIAQDVYASMARIELNGVIKGLDTVARAAGPGGGAIAERIPAFDMRGTKVDLREAIRAAAKDAGIDSQGYDNILEAVDDVFDQDAAATIFRAAETNERGENIVYLWEDGKRVPILMGDDKIAKDIFDQFVAFGADNTNFMLQVGVATTQALRFGVTKSPAYIMVNFFRDQLQTWILSPNYTPFVSGARGLGSTIGNLDDAKRYNAFAGMMGGVDSNLIQTSTAKRDIKSLRKQGFWSVPGGNVVGRTWNGFLRTMEVTEAATRVGHFKETFDRAKSDGMTDVEAAWEAAYAAHDVMDFSRRGAQMHTVARLVAFLNASLQGMDAMRRTVSGERNAHKQVRDLATPYLKAIDGQPLTVAEKQKLPTSARAVIKMLGIGMVGAALWMLYEDDEEAEEFNDYMRATHWFFKMGGTWWRYPKPFELAFFSNAMEAALDRFVKDDPRAGTKFLHSLYHTLVPPHELQVAKFYYEIVTGKDTFSNRDIVSMDLAKLPPEMQYNAYTSEFGKLVGSTLGLSPLQVDHFMQGAFATLGRDTLALSDLVLPQAQKMTGGALPGVTVAPKAEKSFEDMMVLSRFMRRASRGALSTQYFWENMSQSGGHFTAAAEGYKALQEAGRIDPARSRDAKAFLENLKDNEKAYAYLVAEFEEKHKDLHPLHRARQVMRAAGGIRKELLSGDIVKQASTKKGRDLDVIRMTPSDMRKVNEILQDVQMREARNALIVTGVDGWKQKSIMSVDGLLKELRSVSPAVADEYEYRRRKGRNKVYSFAAVKDLWPKAKKRLLEEGPDAFLSDLAAEARAY